MTFLRICCSEKRIKSYICRTGHCFVNIGDIWDRNSHVLMGYECHHTFVTLKINNSRENYRRWQSRYETAVILNNNDKTEKCCHKSEHLPYFIFWQHFFHEYDVLENKSTKFYFCCPAVLGSDGILPFPIMLHTEWMSNLVLRLLRITLLERIGTVLCQAHEILSIYTGSISL